MKIEFDERDLVNPVTRSAPDDNKATPEVIGFRDLSDKTQRHILSTRTKLRAYRWGYGAAVSQHVEDMLAGCETWLVRREWSCPPDRLRELEKEFTETYEDGGRWLDRGALQDHLSGGAEPTAFQVYRDPGPPHDILQITTRYTPVYPVNFIKIDLKL